MRSIRGGVVLLLAMLAGATLASPGWAHEALSAPGRGTSPIRAILDGAAAAASIGAFVDATAAAPAVSTAETGPVGIGVILAILVVSAALAGASRRSRRALVVLLIVVVGAFAFQVGVHSVHHLTQHERDQCVLAFAGSHTSALQVQAIAVPVPAARPADSVLAVSGPLVARAFRPDDGRAPPALLAA